MLIIAVLPIYIVGLYVYNKDKDKEPKKLLRKLFIFGMLSCVPTIILELLIGHFFGEEELMNLWELLIYTLINIALIEEICKWFVVYKLTYHNKEFDHIYDAIVYCIFAALGFAVIENLLYVYIGGVGVGIFRAISAIPGHAAYAVIMATYYGRAKAAEINHNRRNECLNLALSIIAPTIAHTIYDYLLFTGKFILLIVFLIFVVAIYKYSYNKIKALSNVKENLY